MTRRWLLAGLGACAFAADPPVSIRGKLVRTTDGPAIEMPDGRRVRLAGDGPTMEVVNDKRLEGADFEANGQFVSSAVFRVEPIHKRNMFVHKDGHRLQISYWCGVCSIRTWSPGVCMCCQDETQLDLKERFDP
ncbi:MAG: hypothetical protein R2762_29025 [Bryobacteraceae bacterium]